MIIRYSPRSDWNVLRPLLFESIGQTPVSYTHLTLPTN